MCASVAYWCGFKIRGSGKWPNIEKFINAFEEMPSYMASKSDYYTHVMDIPPQYGPPFPSNKHREMGAVIDGKDGAWMLPLPPFDEMNDVEPVIASIDPGEISAKHEAAYKLQKNHYNVAKFSLRATGKAGRKQFSAPLADPYAEPDLKYIDKMETCLQTLCNSLLGDYTEVSIPDTLIESSEKEKKSLSSALAYLRDRIGVPRDMSYPAARQLRAHINWLIKNM